MQDEYTHSLKLRLASLEELDNRLLSDNNIDTIIQKAIDALPEKCREIFVMSKIEGKKTKKQSQKNSTSQSTPLKARWA